jgi:hypothetical protein
MATIQIVALPESVDDLRNEFRAFIDRAKVERWNELNVLFGFAWGNYIYEKDWIEEIMTPVDLADRVARLEAANDGAIGSDDLFVTPLRLGVKYTFCHEADIHLEGPLESDYIAAESMRLKSLGWTICETTKTD